MYGAESMFIVCSVNVSELSLAGSGKKNKTEIIDQTTLYKPKINSIIHVQLHVSARRK